MCYSSFSFSWSERVYFVLDWKKFSSLNLVLCFHQRFQTPVYCRILAKHVQVKVYEVIISCGWWIGYSKGFVTSFCIFKNYCYSKVFVTSLVFVYHQHHLTAHEVRARDFGVIFVIFQIFYYPRCIILIFI